MNVFNTPRSKHDYSFNGQWYGLSALLCHTLIGKIGRRMPIFYQVQTHVSKYIFRDAMICFKSNQISFNSGTSYLVISISNQNNLMAWFTTTGWLVLIPSVNTATELKKNIFVPDENMPFANSLWRQLCDLDYWRLVVYMVLSGIPDSVCQNVRLLLLLYIISKMKLQIMLSPVFFMLLYEFIKTCYHVCMW